MVGLWLHSVDAVDLGLLHSVDEAIDAVAVSVQPYDDLAVRDGLYWSAFWPPWPVLLMV